MYWYEPNCEYIESNKYQFFSRLNSFDIHQTNSSDSNITFVIINNVLSFQEAQDQIL